MRSRPKDFWRFLAATSRYAPNFNPPFRYVLKNKRNILDRLDALVCPNKTLDKYQLFVTERILELPFVFRVLDCKPHNRVLEFGCSNSRLCIELASIGLQVTGVDLRPHPLTHPNFTFRQGDFFLQTFSEAPFDATIAISAVEHVGLGVYGENKRTDGSDRQIIEAFLELLRPGGQLILTVPFGAWNINNFCRIYDNQALTALLRGYNIDFIEYYRRFDYNTWLPTTATELSQHHWSPIGAGAEGVALISARCP